MSGRSILALPWIAFLAAAGASAEVSADDIQPVYETGSKVVIGRVFLSRSERQRLDELRSRPQVVANGVVEQTESTPQRRTQPAGFIRRSSGPARVWRDGDFVAADPAARQQIAFPGDVAITRHDPAADTQSPHDRKPSVPRSSADEAR